MGKDLVSQVAMLDGGSEINLMSRSVYEKGQWPIIKKHGWFLSGINFMKESLYGACPSVPVRVGDLTFKLNFFVQDNSPCTVILGQPFIVHSRMETKVLDNGSSFARVRDEAGGRTVQFMVVQVNHARIRLHVVEGLEIEDSSKEGFQEMLL